MRNSKKRRTPRIDHVPCNGLTTRSSIILRHNSTWRLVSITCLSSSLLFGSETDLATGVDQARLCSCATSTAHSYLRDIQIGMFYENDDDKPTCESCRWLLANWQHMHEMRQLWLVSLGNEEDPFIVRSCSKYDERQVASPRCYIKLYRQGDRRT
jgi:hypothetical protein